MKYYWIKLKSDFLNKTQLTLYDISAYESRSVIDEEEN